MAVRVQQAVHQAQIDDREGGVRGRVDRALVVEAVVELGGGQAVHEPGHRRDQRAVVMVGGVAPHMDGGEQPQAPGGGARLAEVVELVEDRVEPVHDLGHPGVGRLGEQGQERLVDPGPGRGPALGRGATRGADGQQSARHGRPGKEVTTGQGGHRWCSVARAARARGPGTRNASGG
ncbi:hypothetical protein QR300_27555 [Streptomyces antimycoticus]|nr:hypothetical protein [Streptomyces antimycoticus]WJD99441.1 hypothetical protein QR300_27555 [Streptomyces antimycoticus]